MDLIDRAVLGIETGPVRETIETDLVPPPYNFFSSALRDCRVKCAARGVYVEGSRALFDK